LWDDGSYSQHFPKTSREFYVPTALEHVVRNYVVGTRVKGGLAKKCLFRETSFSRLCFPREGK